MLLAHPGDEGPGRSGHVFELHVATEDAAKTPANSVLGSAGYSLIEILVVVGMIGVISAIAIPMTGNSIRTSAHRATRARSRTRVSLAKMRAASNFSQSRVYVDLDGRELPRRNAGRRPSAAWVTEGGAIQLSVGVSFGFGALATAPPNTQATLAQAPPCLTAAGVAIGNTACVVFNSRGIPIDSTGSPTALGAVYLTDGTAVYGVTVSATGLVQLWSSRPSTATWTKQ